MSSTESSSLAVTSNQNLLQIFQDWKTKKSNGNRLKKMEKRFFTDIICRLYRKETSLT